MGSISGDGNGWFIVFKVISRGIDCGGGLRKQRGGDTSSQGRREYKNRLRRI